jgi:hypothetical protein
MAETKGDLPALPIKQSRVEFPSCRNTKWAVAICVVSGVLVSVGTAFAGYQVGWARHEWEMCEEQAICTPYQLCLLAHPEYDGPHQRGDPNPCKDEAKLAKFKPQPSAGDRP